MGRARSNLMCILLQFFLQISVSTIKKTIDIAISVILLKCIAYLKHKIEFLFEFYLKFNSSLPHSL